MKRTIGWLAAGVVVVLVAVSVVVASRTPTLSPQVVAQGEKTYADAVRNADLQARKRFPVVTFFGDSYTGGSDMGGTGAAGWPQIVSNTLNWVTKFSAEGGTGYTAPGPKRNPFPTRVKAVIAQKPDIIILAGGINDGDNPGLEAAAFGVMSALRRGLPDTRIVVVGPFYPTDPTPAVLRGRDAIHAAAQRAGLGDWIDPSNWFAGPRGITGAPQTRLIGADNTHPTDAGHIYLATRLTAEFKRLGLDKLLFYSPPAG